MKDYNGFSNRSTWLARLHLENTSKEVSEAAKSLADKEGQARADKSKWTGINYPHWELLGYEKAAEELLKQKTVFPIEGNKSYGDIKWPEVFEAIRGV